MTDERQRLGRRAEAKALAHLEDAGLTLVTRNWKAAPRPGFGGHGGELDLVMRDGEVLVFVEVRATSPRRGAASTTSAGFGGGAAYSVGRAKQQRLAALAQLFLYGHQPKPRAIRFDVVALTRNGFLGWDLRWYRNAFSV